jgi:hypothetical protein
MGRTLDLGQRVELVSMDPHFSDITIGLYEQTANGVSEYVVHSYSGLPGVWERLEMIMRAMRVLGGIELWPAESSLIRLRFSCGERHQLAMRRTFLEACKLDPHTTVGPRPMSAMDKKLDGLVSARHLGAGRYELAAGSQSAASMARLEAIAAGMRKLAELEATAGEPNRFQFACGHEHDSLVGLLLPRALNVRAVLREQEMAASRGTLVAPSAQK